MYQSWLLPSPSWNLFKCCLFHQVFIDHTLSPHFSIPLPIFVYNIFSLQYILIYSLPDPHQRISTMRAGIISLAFCFISALRKWLILNCAQIFKWMNGWNSSLELEDYLKLLSPNLFTSQHPHQIIFLRYRERKWKGCSGPGMMPGE